MGEVLPVGGIREKVVAAASAEIGDVILPALNKEDLEDVPPEVRAGLRFHFVEHFDEVLELVFGAGWNGLDTVEAPSLSGRLRSLYRDYAPSPLQHLLGELRERFWR